jgi:hypothetical protein
VLTTLILFYLSILLGGWLINTRQVTWILRWLEFTTFTFYAGQMMSQNELSGATFGNAIGTEILSQKNGDFLGIWTAFVLMLALSAIYLITSIVILEIHDKQ